MRKQDVMEHIARLKAASPAKVLAAFEPLEEAVESFFTKDVELERAIGETLYQVAFNYEYRNTVYEHQEVMPAFGTDYPKGYEDARDLFDGGGAWEEMASIPAEEFAKAFAGETASNPYIQRWIEKIRSSRGAIVPGLEAISAFCEADATNNGLTIFFGKQGKVVSSPTRAQTADRVYNIGGYQEIIETYGLGLYVPK